MSSSIHSLQAVQAQSQTEHTVQPPQKVQTPAPNSTPQDTVTISNAGKQAQASNAKASVGGDTDHDGDRA